MRFLIASFLGAFALTACMTSTGQIASSPNAGPGKETLSAFDAGVIFADVCLTRGPNFEGAKQGISGFPFTQNSGTGTYYHNRANLSVKVTNVQCSMVYGTNAPVDDTVKGLADGTASVLKAKAPRGINVTSQVAVDGIRYFRLGIKSPIQ